MRWDRRRLHLSMVKLANTQRFVFFRMLRIWCIGVVIENDNDNEICHRKPYGIIVNCGCISELRFMPKLITFSFAVNYSLFIEMRIKNRMDNETSLAFHCLCHILSVSPDGLRNRSNSCCWEKKLNLMHSSKMYQFLIHLDAVKMSEYVSIMYRSDTE